jgi:hypothetical protein
MSARRVGECKAVRVIRALPAVLCAIVLAALSLVAYGCGGRGPDTDEAAVCRAVQDLVDALNHADAAAAVDAVDQVLATGRHTNNGKLSSRAVALAQVSENRDRQPARDESGELASVAAACSDVGRPIRGLQ